MRDASDLFRVHLYGAILLTVLAVAGTVAGFMAPWDAQRDLDAPGSAGFLLTNALPLTIWGATFVSAIVALAFWWRVIKAKASKPGL